MSTPLSPNEQCIAIFCKVAKFLPLLVGQNENSNVDIFRKVGLDFSRLSMQAIFYLPENKDIQTR